MQKRWQLLGGAARQTKNTGKSSHMIRLQASGRINRQRKNFLWLTGRHFLDIHSTLTRSDDRDAAGATINKHREIEFIRNITAILDIEAADLTPFWASLMRDQSSAKNLTRYVSYLIKGFDNFHAASLTPATSMDLRFYNIDRTAQFLRRRHRLVNRESGLSARNRHAIFSKQGLCLMLMNIH